MLGIFLSVPLVQQDGQLQSAKDISDKTMYTKKPKCTTYFIIFMVLFS